MTKLRLFSKNSASPLRRGRWWLKLGFVLFLGCLVGCGGPKPLPKLSTSQVQKKFEHKCREDFELNVVTNMVGRTMWIYLPVKDPIFDYESQKETGPATDADKKPAKFSVQYADGNFKDGRFSFEYDIVKHTKIKTEENGINSSYTNSYVKAQNNLFTAISDVFFNVDIQDKEHAPLFFVIVITDITKGIEARSTLNLNDFKRFMSGDLPYDEYVKRYLSQTQGTQSMIGDETGTHIKYEDVKLPDFLAKQIINRINFKFQRSDFQPPDDYDDTIVGIISDTTRYYQFKDFKDVQLNNLRQNKKYLFDRDQLAGFSEDKKDLTTEPTPGKLIHIRFDNGKINVDEASPEQTNRSQ